MTHTFQRSRKNWFQNGRPGWEGRRTGTVSSAHRMSWFLRNKKTKTKKKGFWSSNSSHFQYHKDWNKRDDWENLGRALRPLNQEQDWRQEHPFFNPKLETLEKYWRQTSNTITTCAVVLLSFHGEFARERELFGN